MNPANDNPDLRGLTVLELVATSQDASQAGDFMTVIAVTNEMRLRSPEDRRSFQAEFVRRRMKPAD